MKKNLFKNNSMEQPLQSTTGTAPVQQADSVEEIVIYDECGDTLWDKVLAQDALKDTLQQQLPG